MRGKEEAADYRYFPEPDLLKAVIPDAMFETFSKIPELPDEKKSRFITEFGMREYDAAVITADLETAHFFEIMLAEGITAKNAVTWLTVELQGRLKGGLNITTSPVSAKTMGTLVKRIEDKTISGKAAKQVLDHLIENDAEVDAVIEELGLKQMNDTGALEKIIDEIIANNEDKAEQYRGGKEKLLGFFVGQTMKASKGTANPQTVNEMLKAKLG